MKAKRKVGDGSVLQRRYGPGDLRDVWDFCQYDLDQFLELLLWLKSLFDEVAGE